MVEHQMHKPVSHQERKKAGRIWPDWYAMLATFRYSDLRKAAWQLVNTLGPYCCLWYLMIKSIQLGYHHVHHLGPRIPNYHLKECYLAVPELQDIAPLTFVTSLSCIRLKVWDEQRQEMVAFP